MTGNVQFDQRGRRINYILYVNEIHVKVRQTIGTWESANATDIVSTTKYTNGVVNQQSSKEFRVRGNYCLVTRIVASFLGLRTL